MLARNATATAKKIGKTIDLSDFYNPPMLVYNTSQKVRKEKHREKVKPREKGDYKKKRTGGLTKSL
jgi:hypothetical protein